MTSDDLSARGYDFVVTVPLSFGLDFDKSSSAYKGSADVTANGVVAGGKLTQSSVCGIMGVINTDLQK